MKWFIAYFFLIIGVFGFSQSSNWNWAVSIHGPTNEDEIDAIASDANGNVYLSGKFEDSLQLTGYSSALHSNGLADIMLAKYSSEGILKWVKQYGGTGEDNVFDAACDKNGNVYLSGYFQNSIQFDSFTLNSMGGFDAFLVKIDSLGNVLWAKQYGGSSDEGGNEIDISENGQIALIAMSLGDFSFDGFNFINVNKGIRDGFIISLDSDGSVNWIRTIAGVGGCRLKSVGIDALGNIYTGGDFTFQNYIVDELNNHHNLNSNGGKDAFVTCWNSKGDLKWHKQWGGPGDDLCKGITTTADFSVYLAGFFYQDVDFEGTVLSAGATRDFFIWKADTLGNLKWLRHLSSQDDIYFGGEVENDGNGGILMGIGLSNTLQLQDASGYTDFPIPAQGKVNPFLLQYNKNGEIAFTQFADDNSNGNGTFGEITRSGNRIYLDVLLYGNLKFNNTISSGKMANKDAGLVSITLPSAVSDLAQQKNENIHIYPNPVTQQLTVSVPNINFDVSIINMNGQIVQSIKNNTTACVIDCTPLPPSTYQVKVITKSQVYTSLIIIQ